MNTTRRLGPFLLVAVLGGQPLLGESPTCVALVEKGTQTLESRPAGHRGDHDAEGRALTESARQRDVLTQAALDQWARARNRCLAEASSAKDLDRAAHATALAYWVEARSLQVQRQKEAARDTLARGIEAVAAIDEHSPHQAMLYRRLGYFVGATDGVRGTVLMEEALDLLTVAYGERNARRVEAMIDLAIMLPYSVTPTGQIADLSTPEANDVRQRVAELYRAAWEIVQEDPDASAEAIRLAASFYRTWLDGIGEDGQAIRIREQELLEDLAERSKQAGGASTRQD